MPAGAVIYEPSCDGAFRQAEILTDVSQIKRTLSAEQGGSIPVDLVRHPFAIVVSQDCDLDLDFKARNKHLGPDGKTVGPGKMIPNVLLCEVVTAEALKATGRESGDIQGSIWPQIKINNNPRYHFFQQAETELDRAGTGIPELAVDFKRYFSIAPDDLYSQLVRSLNREHGPIQRRLRLKAPYCEHFCTRFSFYLSRIALPEPHLSVTGSN